MHMWEPQVDALAGQFRVLCFDTRGHGASAAPVGYYTVDGLARDVAGLLDALQIQRCHFVGLSMGGMLALALALERPDLIASLVLCDTTSRWPPEVLPVWAERIATVRRDGMAAIVEPTLARWLTASTRTQQPDLVASVAAMILTTPIEGYVGCSYGIPRINFTERLQAIRCPTHIIVGRDDPGTPVEMSRTLHAAVGHSTLDIIDDAAHLSNLEQPAAFNRSLLDFLLAQVRADRS
jgi:3-oxoadipate enol-lactonase